MENGTNQPPHISGALLASSNEKTRRPGKRKGENKNYTCRETAEAAFPNPFTIFGDFFL